MNDSLNGSNSNENHLRILLIARVFPPRIGGIERYIYNIYNRISKSFEISVITPKETGDLIFDDSQTLNVIRTFRLPLIRDRLRTPLVGMIIHAFQEIYRNKPQQIHCDQFESAIISKLLSVYFRIPYIVYAYGMEISDNKWIRLKSWALRDAAAIITISEDTKNKLKELPNISEERIKIVYPGVDTLRFKINRQDSRIRLMYGLCDKKIILTVGRLTHIREKGHDTVIKAMPGIVSCIPNSVYLVVGQGDDRNRLEQLAHKHKIQENIIFVGNVTDENLHEYYQACDVFVMLSRDRVNKHGGILGEGFGIVFLEAGACGKPVIGSKSGGIPDAIVNGETGYLVDPTDLNAVVTAITNLLHDDNLAQRLGNCGRRRIEKYFTWYDTAKKVSKIVTSIYESSL